MSLRFSFAGVCVDHAGFVSESRIDADNSLPPDFVIVEITPPVKRPYSAEITPVSTVVSSIASSTYIGRI